MNRTSITVFDTLLAPLEGCTLIEASAGTGKTYTITRLYLRLLLEGATRKNKGVPEPIPVQSILAVTFTEAATAELKERIYRSIKELLSIVNDPGKKSSDAFSDALLSRLDREHARMLLTLALRDFDATAIHTIHGFCRRVLLEFAFESGELFSSEVRPDESELMLNAVNDFWRANLYAISPLFARFVEQKGLKEPKSLLKLFAAKKGPAAHRIVPFDISDNNTTAAEADAFNKCEAVKELWRAHRSAIIEALLSPALKQNSYGTRAVEKIAPLLDQLIAQKYFDVPANDLLSKVCSGALKRNTKKGASAPEHPFFIACENFVHSLEALSLMFEQKLLHLKSRFLLVAQEYLDREKSVRNMLSFDDLLSRVHRALTGNSGLAQALRNRFSAVLVDEFQDTDPTQYGIFSSVFGSEVPLFLIGDPKQAIYRFRGADIFAYFAASEKADYRSTLTTNYRAHSGLVAAINRLFTEHANPFVFDKIAYTATSAGADDHTLGFTINGEQPPPFIIWTLENGETLPLSNAVSFRAIYRAVATEIGRLLSISNNAFIGEKRVRPSDIAILVRTNEEASSMREWLLEAGIPAVIQVTGSVFESPEAFEFETLLSALCVPKSSPGLLKAALATSFFGLSAQAIDALAENEQEWERLQARARTLHEVWRHDGILAMIRTLVNEESVKVRLAALGGGERSLTNIIHLAELLHVRGLESSLSLPGLVRYHSDKRRERSTSAPAEEEMIRLESDEEAVRIATIHKSKGLEYPIVFCPFNWRSSGIGPQRSHEQPFLFHDPEHGFAPTLALGKEAIERFRSIAEEEALAENMRLLYVALTRAKSRCYCIWCNGKSADIAGLSWLLFGATLGKPCVPKLIEAMTALDPAQASGMIRDRMQGAERVFLLEPLPYSSPQQRIPPDTESVIAECRKFSGRIPPPRLVHSYSSLAHQVEGPRVDAPDYDLFPTGIAMIENAPVNRFVSIIDFPRGAKAGTFLHEIFELLDFSSISKIEPALPDLLARKGFEPSWAGVITDLAHDISALRLDPNTDLSLSAISAEQCIKEMEFYFPLKPFSLPDLYRLTGEQSDGISHFGLAEAGGFMKGFIDLIFEWKGRYYIVDWKSNYLGSAAEDYLPEALRAVMEREHYLLQYHLYIVALHNYLALRLPGYRYDDHFGGVYYLFLRGIGKDPHSRNGVFFDRPEMIKIAGFKSLLSKYR